MSNRRMISLQLTHGFIFFFIMMCINSCTEPKPIKKEETRYEVETNTARHASGNVIVKNRSLYSEKFLSFHEQDENSEPIQIIGGNLIASKDTVQFPDDLQLNKTYSFTAEKGTESYKLQAKRINWTTIDYAYEHKDGSKLKFAKKGRADLQPMFFLAAEGDNDSETGEGYAAYEYLNDENDCVFVIRIGVGSDSRGRKRTKVTNWCKGDPEIDLESQVTLRAE